MKQLIWKEWHELRWLPLASVLCVVLLTVGGMDYLRTNHQPFKIADLIPGLVMTWGFFCLIAGAGLFSSEIGTGSLSFLSVLPICRRRIWAVKVTVALGMLTLSLLVSAIVWTILASVLLHSTSASDWMFIRQNGGDLLIGLLYLSIFSVSLAVSTFLDRPLSVLLMSVLVFSISFFGLEAWRHSYVTQRMAAYYGIFYPGYGIVPAQHSLFALESLIAILVLLVFTSISYWTFTRGETLRSAKRFRIGAISGAVSAAIAWAVFWVGSGLQWW